VNKTYYAPPSSGWDTPAALRLAGVLDTTPDFQMRAREAARELRRLHALVEQLLEALHNISLCSQNSMSSQRQCGEIARAAIAKSKSAP
jgi:hypothetical protein